jgi:FMNH2-dependent dimethyl sulfone monooxygenase
VHAPLFNPLIAAKEFVTADHIGEGRFGLNVVCGWNEGEFDMFGVGQRDHDRRYDYAHEWINIVKRAWGAEADWDFEGEFFQMRGVRMNPKPFAGTQPLIMNAGASTNGRAFALKNCDAFFTTATRTDPAKTAERVRGIKEEARSYGREIGVFTVGVVTCRPTQAEAEHYHRYATVERADWRAVQDILALKNISPASVGSETYEAQRQAYANGMGGLPIVGDPDHVAAVLAELADSGLSGIGISFVNYALELPFFVQEVLPRLSKMGLRS